MKYLKNRMRNKTLEQMEKDIDFSIAAAWALYLLAFGLMIIGG